MVLSDRGCLYVLCIKKLVKQGGGSLSLEGIRKVGLRVTPTRLTWTGSSPKLTPEEKRQVANAVRRDPFISLGTLRCQEAPHASDMTLSRILMAAGRSSRLARVKPFLTPHNCATTGDGIQHLSFYEPTLTSKKYLQLIGGFFSSIPHSRITLRRRRVFIHDYAPCHSTTAVRNYLHQHVTLDCLPPSSPDLNVIENCWALVKRRPLLRHMTTGQLQPAEWDAWNSIPVAFCCAVASMPARCRVVFVV